MSDRCVDQSFEIEHDNLCTNNDIELHTLFVDLIAYDREKQGKEIEIKTVANIISSIPLQP